MEVEGGAWQSGEYNFCVCSERVVESKGCMYVCSRGWEEVCMFKFTALM